MHAPKLSGLTNFDGFLKSPTVSLSRARMFSGSAAATSTGSEATGSVSERAGGKQKRMSCWCCIDESDLTMKKIN